MDEKEDFPGFGLETNFTKIPHTFIREKMHNLNGNAVKVMLYILDRTYGFPDKKGRPKKFDAISYDQFANGILTREGKQLDQGTGLTVKSIKRSLEELEIVGLVFIHTRQTKATGEWLPTVYEPNVDGKTCYKYAASEIQPPKLLKTKKEPAGLVTKPVHSINQSLNGTTSPRQVLAPGESFDNLYQKATGGVSESHMLQKATPLIELAKEGNISPSTQGVEKIHLMQAEIEPEIVLPENYSEPEIISIQYDNSIDTELLPMGDMTKGFGSYDQRVGSQVTEGMVDLTNTKESTKRKGTRESLQEKEGTASIAYAIDGAKAPTATSIKSFFSLTYNDLVQLLSFTYRIFTLQEAALAVKWAEQNGITPAELKTIGEKARHRIPDERERVFEELINEFHREKFSGTVAS